MLKNSLKWERTATRWPNDHIVSSKAKSMGDAGFRPQFLNERYKMGHLMGNEYMRLWFKERAFYEKENVMKLEKGYIDQSLKRRYVQRMMAPNPRRKPKELPTMRATKKHQKPEVKLDLKGSKNKQKIIVRTDYGDREVCVRYPKAIEPVALDPFKPDCLARSSATSPRLQERKKPQTAPRRANTTYRGKENKVLLEEEEEKEACITADDKNKKMGCREKCAGASKGVKKNGLSDLEGSP